MTLKSINMAIDNRLSARLELNADKPIVGYGIISHCFTCTKETLTASRVSRGLARLGFAMVRFDFTGLGDSNGSFSDSNFTTMVEDIEAVADFLAHHYQPPSILIGHSMGGTASLVAATDIASCKAVVTIASPSTPEHVLHHFGSAMPELEAGHDSEIQVAGKRYPVKPQFIDDVRSYPMLDKVNHLKLPVLAIRAGKDRLVKAEDADEIINYSNKESRIVDYPDADHLFSDRDITADLIDKISNWFNGLE